MSNTDIHLPPQDSCEAEADLSNTLSEKESLAFRAISAVRTHCKATLLSLWVLVWTTAATAQEDTSFVQWAEYEVAQVWWEVLTPIVFENPEVVPSSDEMTEAFPDISQAALTAFIQNFDTLGDVEKGVFLDRFMELSDADKNLALRIYQSAYESVTHPILKKVLVKSSISLMDVRENLQYILDNNGDIRNGDAIDIFLVLDTVLDKFPETAEVLDVAFLEETRVLYENAGLAVRNRHASLSASVASLEEELERITERNRILEDQIRRLDILIEQLKALDAVDVAELN